MFSVVQPSNNKGEVFQGSGKHESLCLKLVHSFWKKPYDGNILHHVSSESVWCFPFLNIQVTFLLDLVLPTVFFLCHENYILIVSFKLKVAHTEAKKLRLKCHDSISFKQEKLLPVVSNYPHFAVTIISPSIYLLFSVVINCIIFLPLGFCISRHKCVWSSIFFNTLGLLKSFTLSTTLSVGFANMVLL